MKDQTNYQHSSRAKNVALWLLMEDQINYQRPSRAKNMALWLLQILTAAALLMAGFAKLSGQPMMVETFDKISLGLLRVKARAMPVADLELLLNHERTHGGRPGVLSLLETRIAQLQQEQSAG